jgi:hypothetical protein
MSAEIPLPPPGEEPNYEGLPLVEQIRLLQEWAPLIGYGQRFLSVNDAYARALIVGEALQWLAAKTRTKLDDGFTRHVSAMLATKEGEAFVRWAIGSVEVPK